MWGDLQYGNYCPSFKRLCDEVFDKSEWCYRHNFTALSGKFVGCFFSFHDLNLSNNGGPHSLQFIEWF